ncbi:MAG: hypothetical protein CVV02_04575 [Firmicutes bacterium HGW-Firmicutes-7]|nr:MAG: hypothetical protein CVV02_04575 [Firmicutes bacterium HGW-Firmicutes-7]
MHDTFLFENIKKAVFTLCENNAIKRLTYINVSVYVESHVNEVALYNKLKDSNSNLIGDWTKVAVEHNNPKRLTATINQIEGD